jgi:hypothetical protein
VKATARAGRADFFTDLAYDDSTGTVSVHDSDIFSDADPSKELAHARVSDRTRTLAPSDRDALVADLAKSCATPKVLEARCAPGGCTRAEVRAPSGTVTVIENNDFAFDVFRKIVAFFPELRVSKK